MYSENPRSYGTLRAARDLFSKNPKSRKQLIDCLLGIEADLQKGSDHNIREELVGPLVDLIFEDNELLQKRVRGGLTFNFRYSSKIARDFVLATEAEPDHVWEPQTTKSVIALSKGRKQVLIGGAYIGDHALYAARQLASGGTVHCFELSDSSVDLLKANLRDNNIANAVVNQQALWSEDGKWIELTGEDSHASPQEAASKDKAFPSRSVDGYLAEKGVTELDLLMLDIEGGEYKALQGAAKILASEKTNAPAVICEIHRHYVDWSNGLRNTPLCGLLIDNGYEVFAIRDYQGNENVQPPHVELVDIDSAVVSGPPHGFNLLAVKDRSRLDPSVFRIVHNVSPKLLKHRDPKIHAPLAVGHEKP